MSRFFIFRKQRPVGHGFFHEGVLRTPTGTGFRWIYDCGGGKEIKREVGEYLKETKCADIDLLFLSHLHADHVGGLPELLRHAKVKIAILPHITQIERFLILVRSIADTTFRLWYINFVRDPVGWLQANGVEQVITIAHGGEPTPEPDEDRARERSGDEPPPKVTLRDGRGREVPLASVAGQPIADNHSIVFGGQQTLLRFSLYVREAELSDLEKLMLKLRGTDVIRSLTSKEGLRTLRAAYGSVWRDINRTSLCVACVPGAGFEFLYTRWDKELCGFPDGVMKGLGWLGLGDAVLKSRDEVESLKSHFGPVLEQIITWSLPHHGSEANYSEELLHLAGWPVYWRLQLVYVTAKKGASKHPSPSVRRSCEEHCRGLHVVTEEKETEIFEKIVMLRR